MLFKDFHIYPMHIGIKIYTRRTWKRPHVKIGGTYPVTHKMYYSPEDIIGYIHVEDLYRQPLCSMTDKDAFNEGGYDLKSYMEVLTQINDRQRPYVPMLWTTVVWVVKFRFTLSDMIDPNGGTQMIDDYYRAWETHMRSLGISTHNHIAVRSDNG